MKSDGRPQPVWILAREESPHRDLIHIFLFLGGERKEIKREYVCVYVVAEE